VDGHAGLTLLFVAWVIGCVLVAAWSFRRAPGVTLALIGAIIGALGAFALGDDQTQAGVPLTMAWSASVGLGANGVAGTLLAAPAGPPVHLRRAGTWVLLGAPIATALFTWALRTACPLYTHGKGSGYCNYRKMDLLGGWSSEVLALFFLDAVFLGLLMLVPARRVRPGRQAAGPRGRTINTAVSDSHSSGMSRARTKSCLS
jgi:hypothetical protein